MLIGLEKLEFFLSYSKTKSQLTAYNC